MNIRPLTPHIMPCYTHKMATYRGHRFCDVTSPHVQRFAFGKQTGRTATGNRVPYGITQCCLPPDIADIPAVTPAKLVLDLATQKGCKDELT